MSHEPPERRLRACGAILRGDTILMVQHCHDWGTYWTLPGGGVEASETPTQAVIREVLEETGLSASPVRYLFTEEYDHIVCECYLLTAPVAAEAILGSDPEEADLPAEQRMLKQVAWQPLEQVRDDAQVAKVLRALSHDLTDEGPA